ncbi:ubiquinone/menaquinone biosynthesis methyltransferase [Iamia sp.]|uniref:ubiquinone/menaquinone biosynthesis methyltransferase n=1 Tax=Iamia sp. TaxID=2722710 RepID=UPI002C363897|nr:ubiquinone/menaquinone biosynthesis methyltransferase [Iamia sp.]HXH58147.1 ubiquinone/menaquinone biosynthesis methyltransferase [Iamia sp.]
MTSRPAPSGRPIATGALPDADRLPSGEEKVQAVRVMFDTIAPRYDLVNRVMTFRMDVGWRRRTVRDLDLPIGSLVLDLACGTGDLCTELVRGGHRPVGVDLSFGMLAAARTRAPLVHGDVLRLPVPDGSIDGVTCGFALRNLEELPRFFIELARVLRPGGRIALLEVAEPPNPVLRAGHALYFGRVVPRLGGLLSDPAAYRYLPKSVSYLPSAERMLALLDEAGFTAPRHDLLTVGIARLVTATRGAADAGPVPDACDAAGVEPVPDP